ncbi:zinc ribbon domain-containing protein [bacterium]|nr:zinc ribbon domain-containing protein [bacterium]
MPIYEYECGACGEIFERMQRMSDPSPEKCGKCGGGPIQRLISRSGFILKGGGFYTNEYPSASRQQGQGGEKTCAQSSCATSPAPASSSNGCTGCCQTGGQKK